MASRSSGPDPSDSVRTGPLSIGVVGGRARVMRQDRPMVLRTATEHYGALLNAAFDYRPYLEMLARSGCTLTRTFVLFRELQSAVNPYSTCKPESIDYLAPYARVDASRDDPIALDGQPLFDLDRWDEQFFDRLHDFAGRADELGVTVELTLFSNTYADPVWDLNPTHQANNVNELTPIHWTEYITARHPDRLERQLALVDKIVTECRDHPNVIFEPCNEPGAGAPVEGDVAAVDQGEVNAWLDLVIARIRAADGGRHLIAGQEAFRYEPWDQPLDRSMDAMDLDIVNVHPLPGTTLGGRTYELGRFMSGDLVLAEVRDFCQAAAAGAKPVNLDEDNTASQYTDHYGWTIHRKRAWFAVLSGCHYDVIDFTIRPGLPIGSPAAQDDLRRWTEALGEACDRWDLGSGEFLEDVRVRAGEVLAVAVRVAATGGEDGLVTDRVVVYLADPAEGTRRHPAVAPVMATIEIPAGYRSIRAVRPADGIEADPPTVRPDGSIDVEVVEDLILELGR